MSGTRWVVVGFLLCGIAGVAVMAPGSGSSRGDKSRPPRDVECGAEQAASCTHLGLALLKDTAPGRDAARAYSLFQKGCAGGDADGCVEQAVLLLDGTGVKKDAARAAAVLGTACDTGSPRACSLLAWMYEQGRGVERDTARAAFMYRRACDEGLPRACTQLGGMLASTPDAGEADGTRALQLFDQGCEGGDLLACRQKAQAHECGRAVPADLDQATEQYFKACGAGDGASCEWLASRHSEEATHLDRFAGTPGFQSLQLQAAIEAARFGRRSRAEALLLRVEDAAPELKPRVAFVRACLALDAGDVAGAESLLQGLPDDPALRVLRRLLAQRRDGATQWTSAMVSAWVAEGRPDLRASLFLPSARQQEGDRNACNTPREQRSPPPGLDAATAFLLEYSNTLAPNADAPVSEAMLAQALTRVEDARIEVRIVALDILTRSSLTQAQRRKAHPIAVRHLDRLAKEHPDNLFFQLWALLGPVTPPLTEELVGKLEAMAALRFEPPLREVYSAFSAAHAQAGEGRLPAFGATISALLAPRYTHAATDWAALGRKTEPTLRQHLGQALMAVGRRITEGGWMVHVFGGSTVMTQGTTLTESPADEEAVKEMRERGRSFLSGVETMRALGSWPLSTFTAEWLDRVSTEELAFYTELSQKGAW
ncbi:sel1 repeat family protein [Pyxidicoccus fallax]|uniref:Sel1 repeat family protein n=1 Tax=Pyxidicoccus fallax TaxID=394095 RepID=A0A848LI07_9BACT|nr:tetratricopeptide repeat protein [Pyxidicoccus fallax]NMO16958.1 sel1 repeat family protein [Pyxidicoccus fallax]NPC82742.1 sel1 repeat family protein [Pyxidicoccus fallax]